MGVLPREAIRLGMTASSKEDAILIAGRILEELGTVAPGYADAMIERELSISTSIGEGFAIPHGTDASRALVHRTGLSFVQFPAGIDWNGDRVFVCIGIAARDDAHMEILGQLANILVEPDQAAQLREASDPTLVLSILGPALEEAPAETDDEDGAAPRAG
jgi:mannitol/fructose-specific phosphotransferase system IIA component